MYQISLVFYRTDDDDNPEPINTIAEAISAMEEFGWPQPQPISMEHVGTFIVTVPYGVEEELLREGYYEDNYHTENGMLEINIEMP